MTTNVNLGFVAAATGTVDAITATYSPAPTALVDKMLLWFRATGANTSTTPTFSPNGLTAHTIVKQGGTALVAGDIPAANAIMEVVYDATNTRWELLNPANGKSYLFSSSTTEVGLPNSTTHTSLWSETIPAGRLNNGDMVRVTIWGHSATNNNTKHIQFEYEGNAIDDFSASTDFNGKDWKLETTFICFDNTSIAQTTALTIGNNAIGTSLVGMDTETVFSNGLNNSLSLGITCWTDQDDTTGVNDLIKKGATVEIFKR